MDESDMKKIADMELKTNTYHFLGCQDRHLVRLFHWVQIISDFSSEVRECDQDNELFDELTKINNRLIHEIGTRMVMIFP